MYAVCSVATINYLPGLITLYRSILRHQEIPLFLMVADADPAEIPKIADAIRAHLPERAQGLFQAICPTDTYGDATDRMRFYYNALEFSNACKAGMHAWMHDHTDMERWLYLDTDMLCFGSLAPVFSALDGHNLLLTPHRNRPAADISKSLNQLGYGAFNAGMLGVRRSAVSKLFIDWYLKALSHYCLNDIAWPKPLQFPCRTVLAADQRWLDLVPTYFSGVCIAQQRGFNVGHWNIDQDSLNQRGNMLHIGDDPIIFLHLSGWSATTPSRFSRHTKIDWSDDPVWHQVYSGYLEEIMPLRSMFDQPYRYANYPDGTAITHEDRRNYLSEVLADTAPPGSPFGQKSRFLSARRPQKWKWRKKLHNWLHSCATGKTT